VADDAAAADAAAVTACLRVNEALLHRVATGRPFSVWKYAMTLDGKIATRSGHSAWVSGTSGRAARVATVLAGRHAKRGLRRVLTWCVSPPAPGPAARQRVYVERARSDAILVGGNTLRRDNPQLTTRQLGGHTPTRIVVSRSLDLPEVRRAESSAATSAQR
jgi:diaminohydroxyphosphoribosylaminopyrimidine deaminase/5-amino-6-(5-phosphoribosylamino)uracil reductase